MKKRTFLLLIGASPVLSLNLGSCTGGQGKAVALTISCANSYHVVIKEIDQIYRQANPQVTTTYNIANTGVLQRQIQMGFPVDVVITSYPKRMDKLQAAGLIFADTRTNITRNSLVLIVPKNSTRISGFRDLATDKVKSVILGDEKLGAGIYAKETLTFFQIYDQVKPKAIFAHEGSGQIIEYMEQKKADAGVTFLTEVKYSDKVKVVAVAPENSHEPILGMVAITKNSTNYSTAKGYINFLKSAPAKSVFQKYGFTPVD